MINNIFFSWCDSVLEIIQESRVEKKCLEIQVFGSRDLFSIHSIQTLAIQQFTSALREVSDAEENIDISYI